MLWRGRRFPMRRVPLSVAKLALLLVLHLVLFGAGSAFFVGDALPAPPPTPEESLEQVAALLAIAVIDVVLLAALAARVPCVWAGNFSVGVNLLFALTRRAAAVLGEDYDAELVEMHHRFKQDAPSGTAARLLEIILEERGRDENVLRHGRHGITGARPGGEVGDYG